jgi:hypothetical protein
MSKCTIVDNDPTGNLNQPEQPGDGPPDQSDTQPPLPAVADRSKGLLAALKDTAQRLVHPPALTQDERGHRATGGRLELLGGSLGTGIVLIKRFGPERRIGFISPAGEHVDLESEVESVASLPDQQEHRLLSATGWALAAGAIVGPLGVAVGGGVRLLHPKRMMLDVRLRNGRMLTARTDSVTCAALQALATGHRAPERVA